MILPKYFVSTDKEIVCKELIIAGQNVFGSRNKLVLGEINGAILGKVVEAVCQKGIYGPGGRVNGVLVYPLVGEHLVRKTKIATLEAFVAGTRVGSRP